jgi:hypothetical protein
MADIVRLQSSYVAFRIIHPVQALYWVEPTSGDFLITHRDRRSEGCGFGRNFLDRVFLTKTAKSQFLPQCGQSVRLFGICTFPFNCHQLAEHLVEIDDLAVVSEDVRILRLALYGLTLVVKKPSSDQEQD